MGSGRPSWVVQDLQVRIVAVVSGSVSGCAGVESLDGTYEEGISLWKRDVCSMRYNTLDYLHALS